MGENLLNDLSQTSFLERFVPEVVFGTICPKGRFWNDLSQRSFLERFVPEVVFVEANIAENHPKSLQNQPQIAPKPTQNRSKTHSGGQHASR